MGPLAEGVGEPTGGQLPGGILQVSKCQVQIVFVVNGQIAAFDATSGQFVGMMRGKRKPITIDGLWGLGFGNDGNAGASTTLFFTAGIQDESHGLLGTLTPIPATKGN